MKVVVITGGIGSGKSWACRYLSDRYGWPVYEADERVKQLYESHPSLLAEIESALGRGFRDGRNRFSPRLLSEVIFKDKTALERVEELVFPVLTQDFENWKSVHATSGVVIIESATILEKPQLAGLGDIYLLIDAPVDLRLSRAVSRDAASKEKIIQRMQAQKLMNDISYGKVKAPVDYVVFNDDSAEKFAAKLEELAAKIS